MPPSFLREHLQGNNDEIVVNFCSSKKRMFFFSVRATNTEEVQTSPGAYHICLTTLK